MTAVDDDLVRRALEASILARTAADQRRTADGSGRRHHRKLNRLDQFAASIFYVLAGILLGAQLVHRYETLFAFGLMFGAFAAIYFTIFRPVERPTAQVEQQD